MNQNRLQPDSLRAGELVVGAVAHEHRLAGLDTQLLTCEVVDPGIGLQHSDRAREDGGVEEIRERRLGPDVRHVLAADRDQPDPPAAGAKLGDRFDRPGPRHQQPASRIAPQGHQFVDDFVRRADLEQIAAQRPAFALGPAFDPESGELVRVPADSSRDLILKRPPRDGVEVDKRVPQVENDRANQTLRTRTAVP